MSKIISFEKFVALTAAGLDEREARGAHHAPQIHSASENFVQTVQHRAGKGAQRGY